MKKNDRIDQLIDLAFGELDARQTAEVEAWVAADSKLKEELAGLKALKEDLSLLREVPSHQLSNARLREAIDRAEARPKVWTLASIQWMWMPAAAAMLVAGFFVVKNANRPNTIVPELNVPSSSVATNFRAESGAAKAFPEIVQSVKPNGEASAFAPDFGVSGEIERAMSAQDGLKVVRSTKKPRTSNLGRPPVIETTQRSSSIPLENLSASAMTSTKAAPFAASAPVADSMQNAALEGTSAPAESPSESSVVLINRTSDQESGALEAEELQNNGHVIVGG